MSITPLAAPTPNTWHLAPGTWSRAPSTKALARGPGRLGNQKSGKGGPKKQAEFRTGLTQTGPKPACFLDVPANRGITGRSICLLSLPKVFVPQLQSFL